jgi:hypothetical protein
MNPLTAASFMSSVAGGDSAPVGSSATAIARAGDGDMTFGGGKNQTVLVISAVAAFALVAVLLLKKK